MTLSGDLEDFLGIELPASLAFRYPTIHALTRHLAKELEKNDR